MTAVTAFTTADRGESVSYSLLLRDVKDTKRLIDIMPAGSVVKLPGLLEGCPNIDSGYRGIMVYQRDADAFLGRLAAADIAECIYRVEPRALRPVQLPAPSASRP
ncbi:MAG: hypothetical protein KGQ41_07690 [Alphaproteobacteria bacterium]|nr:hypothetical protein [Alphaproteobacteria bacterium]